MNHQNTRYCSGAKLLFKSSNIKYENGRIDMGYGTGISIGIYDNVFKDRPRFLNGVRDFHKKICGKAANRFVVKKCVSV